MAKDTVALKKIDDIVKKFDSSQSALIGMLQHVQIEYNYLPKKALERIAEKVDIPISRVYSLATFYSAFSLKPRGKYLVALCVGTACHVRGAGEIQKEIEKKLKIQPGQTTEDSRFTFETVNCLGCCAIGPVMTIGDKYYGELTPSRAISIIEKYKNG